MLPTSKVLWGEGLFIRPQHFQQQDAYQEWRVVQAMMTLHPYAWGVRSLEIDADALKAGRLRLLDLQLVLPDGEMYNAPAQDPLPEPLALNAVFGQDNEVFFHAVLSSLRAQGSNLENTRQDGSSDSGARYFPLERDVSDQFTDAADAPITFLGKRLRIVVRGDVRQDMVGLPLLKLRRNASGGFDVDPRFIAPSTSIAAAPIMRLHLRRLLDVLQAKVDALYGMHREPAKNIIEFRSGDAASFWLLHTASSAYATLSHLVQHPGLHPERLFEHLLSLAGALMAFSKGYSLGDLPAYDHREPGMGFFRLNDIIRDLLETVISTRYFSIPLQESESYFHRGRLDAPQISESTRFYLGISAALSPAELVETMPALIKIGSPEDVESLLTSAMSGVGITHVAQVPAAIPVRPGCYYFSLDHQGVLYERMLRSQAISLYVPPGVPDIKLELMALT